MTDTPLLDRLEYLDGLMSGLEDAWARRRANRAARSHAAHRGWQTRRIHEREGVR